MRTLTHLRTLALTALLPVLFTACGGSGDDDDTNAAFDTTAGTAGTDIIQRCRIDADCPLPLICVDLVCQPQTGTTTGDDTSSTGPVGNVTDGGDDEITTTTTGGSSGDDGTGAETDVTDAGSETDGSNGLSCPMSKDCTGRECGPDPKCGISCGRCKGNTMCSDTGQCECSQTASTTCSSGDVYYTDCNGALTGKKQECGSDSCVDGGCVCVPQCDDKKCGDDGCGGSCTYRCPLATPVCDDPTNECQRAADCDADADCGEKQLCIGGSCFPLPPCSADYSCFLVGVEACSDTPPWIGGPGSSSLIDWFVTENIARIANNENIVIGGEVCETTELLGLFTGGFFCDSSDNLCHPVVDSADATPQSGYEIFPGRYLSSCSQIDQPHDGAICTSRVLDCSSLGFADDLDYCYVLVPDQMVTVPEGSFQRGCNSDVDTLCESDESPYKPITLSTYKIDQTEVTVAAYKRCVDAGVCGSPNSGAPCNWGVSGRESYPINCVDWFQADDYCRWAGKRLPTEAEWEKAARGSDGWKYPWGNTEAKCNKANFRNNLPCLFGTSVVGSLPAGASPYGALDMAGNVREWVEDWYDSGYYSASPEQNPQGPLSSQAGLRVVRGGSWADSPANARASDRLGSDPTIRGDRNGFRCAQ